MGGWERIRREPYRLLFPLGIAFGCLGVAHWLLYALGVADASPFYHASMQLGAYVYCFIVGFLWTALPRMSGTAIASHGELGILLGLLAAHVALLTLRQTMLAQLCYAGLLILLVAFALRRLAARPRHARPRMSGQGPTEFVWIPVGACFGVCGSALQAAAALMPVPGWLAAGGRVMAQQGFTLSLVIGVAGFMAPRLMGRAASIVPPGLTAGQATQARRARVARHLLAAGALGVSFIIEGAGAIRAAYALRVIVVTAELGWRARWWRAPAVKDFYVRLLWVSLWCVIIGLWAVACWPTHRAAMLHLALIGGFSLMMFSVGTMVVLSHAGEADALRRPLWILQVVAVGVMGATVARVLADWLPAHYFVLLATAAASWLAAGISWFWFALPWVVRAAPEGAFERAHEQAKQRLLREQAASC